MKKFKKTLALDTFECTNLSKSYNTTYFIIFNYVFSIYKTLN